MGDFYTFQDGNYARLPGSPSEFKTFKKTVNKCLSNGFGTVYQAVPKESIIFSVMRFEFDEEIGSNVLDADSIGRMVFVHQQVITQVIPHISANDLTCFVMTHPQVETETSFIEEVYFFFPRIKCPVQSMVDYINPGVRKYFSDSMIHERLELKPINELEEIVNPEFYQRPWPMPGSYIYGNLLTISHVFDKITEEQLNDGVIVSFPPDAYFNNFQIPDGSDYDIHSSFYFADLNGFTEIPRKRTQREKARDHTSRMIDCRQKEQKRTTAELCSIFLGMLNPDRFAMESDRNKIGRVLFNVTQGNREGLELWQEFNTRKLEAFNNAYPDIEGAAMSVGMTPEQFQEAVDRGDQNLSSVQIRIPDNDLQITIENINEASEDIWNFLDFDDCTIGTLRYWAKMDSPQLYKAFLHNDVTSLAWRALNPIASHTEVGKLIYAMYSDQIVCANIKDNVWFGHWNHRWHELDKCHYLRIRISSEVASVFEKILDECKADYDKAINDSDKEVAASYMSSCTKMIKNLRTVGYKTSIVQECSEHFYDPDFIDKLDENRNLLGLPNGVYDLETGEHRPGKPEDFLTLCTKAKYNSNFHWDHPKIKEVTYYFKTVYPDIKLRHYIQKAYASILEGGNMNKDFYNMIGHGDNSKSMVAKALKNCLGKYIAKIPVALLMGKRGNADNATPHLADKKGIRALFAEEAPRGQSNVSVIKELSGNDDVCARALFKMPITFSPQWKLFMWSNHMLLAEAEEKAYWNRQKVVDHESLYSFNAPESVEEQFATKTFPRDPLFDAKVLAMADALLWCLTEWYKIYKIEGLTPPARVLQATNMAKLKNDIYLQYMKDALVQGTQHNSISVDKMYEDFRNWHQKTYQSRQVVNRMEFEEAMSRPGYLGCEPNLQRQWVGVNFKVQPIALPTTTNNNDGPPSMVRGASGNAPMPIFAQ